MLSFHIKIVFLIRILMIFFVVMAENLIGAEITFQAFQRS